MRRLLMPLVAAILLVPGVAAAQSAPADEARATELGKQYITWIFDFQVDSLYEAMTPEFRDQIGGREAIEGAITQTLTQQGLESEGGELQLPSRLPVRGQQRPAHGMDVRHHARGQDVLRRDAALLWRVTGTARPRTSRSRRRATP